MKDLYLKEKLTGEEKSELLRLFKILLIEKPDYLKDERNTPNETVDQACFISGGYKDECGEYDAIFFPNSEFNKKMICLAYSSNKPCMVIEHSYKFSKKEKTFIVSESLENLIYEYEEIDEMQNYNKTIENYKENIEYLESIKRIKRKDNTNFKILNQNFKSNHSFTVEPFAKNETILKIHLYKSEYIYITCVIKKDFDHINADDVEDAIKENIENMKKCIKKIEEEKKALHSETKKAIKIFKELEEKAKSQKTKILRRILEQRLYKL